MEKAAFIDRDGTILKSILKRITMDGKTQLCPISPHALKEFKLYPKVTESLVLLKKLGFLRILVTNQPDVAYGHLCEEDWQCIQKRIEWLGFDDIFICRHTRYQKCYFRKPSPGMLLAAADKWNINLAGSWMIGDTSADTEAGKAAGCKTILLARNYNADVKSDYIAKNIWGAVKFIQKHIIKG